MLINLQNYINLSAFNAPSIHFHGTVLGGTGQGTGLQGILGDWTPPSRFVRMTTFLRFANKPKNASDGVNLAEHLLNVVDIPKGAIRERRGKSGSTEDFTQWVVIKDQTNRIFYFRSYEDLCLKSIDMKGVNFGPDAKGSVSIEMRRNILDATHLLK